MRYLKLEICKKSETKILLEDHVNITKEKAEKIAELCKSISVINSHFYDVNDYMKNNIKGVTVEKSISNGQYVDVTYCKNDDYHTIQLPKNLLTRKTEISISVPISKNHGVINYDSKSNLITWKSKGDHNLKTGEILIRVN